MLQLPFQGSTFAFWGGPQHCAIVHHRCKYLTQIKHLFGHIKNISLALGFYTKMALQKIPGSPQDQPNTGQNNHHNQPPVQAEFPGRGWATRNRAGDIRHHLAHLQRWIEQKNGERKKKHEHLTNDMENPHVFW